MNGATVKLAYTQLNKVKSAARNKTETILRLNMKILEDEELWHELFLTPRQKTKMRNAFANIMLSDIKLSKAQISKIILSGGPFSYWFGNLEKKTLTNIAIPLATDNLLGLLSNLTSNAINKFERKISGKRVVRAGKIWRILLKS